MRKTVSESYPFKPSVGNCFFPENMDLAVEVKGSGRIHRGYTRGLNALQEEFSIGRTIVVSLKKQQRRVDTAIEVMPWQIFLDVLWSGGFGV
jgi:predicted AAA+ superfamily ATPase